MAIEKKSLVHDAERGTSQWWADNVAQHLVRKNSQRWTIVQSQESVIDHREKEAEKKKGGVVNVAPESNRPDPSEIPASVVLRHIESSKTLGNLDSIKAQLGTRVKEFEGQINSKAEQIKALIRAGEPTPQKPQATQPDALKIEEKPKTGRGRKPNKQ